MAMKNSMLFISVLCCLPFYISAQSVSINTSGNPPDSSAILDVQSTEKGMLIPRMSSAQRLGIGSPATGLLVFDTTRAEYMYYNDSFWRSIGDGTIWKTNIDTLFTLYNHVAIGSSQLDSNVNLFVDGSLFVNGTLYGSDQQPEVYLLNQFDIFIYDSAAIVYDNGGPLGNYSGSNSYNFLAVPVPDGIYGATITVDSFDVDDSDQLILSLGGPSTPINGDTVIHFFGTSFGGHFESDGPMVGGGFKIIIEWLYADTSSVLLNSAVGLYFDHHKSALRGGVDQPQNWSGPNIGYSSFSFGENNKVTGRSSWSIGAGNVSSGPQNGSWGENNITSNVQATAWGKNNNATGSESTAFGNSTQATANNSTTWGVATKAMASSATAWGVFTQATGSYATAWGNGTIALGSGSTAFGDDNESTGDYSTSWGRDNIASGFYSSATGFGSKGRGFVSFVTGLNNYAHGYSSFVVGVYNDSIISPQTGFNQITSNTPLFIVGNGNSNNDRTNAMVVRKDGRVGIGNSLPLYNLHVGDGNISATNGSDTRLVVSDNDNNQRAAFLSLAKTTEGSKVEAQLEANGSSNAGPSVIIGAATSHPLYLRTGNLTRMTISASGDIGIRTTSPGSELTIKQDGLTANDGIKLISSSSSNDWNIHYDSGGDLAFAKNGVDKGVIDAVSGAYTALSDIKFKENVTELNPVLSDALKLRPVSYYFKDQNDRGTKEIGIIAQELEKVFPQFVYDHQDFKTINYAGLSIIAIKAIQELYEMNISMNAHIDAQNELIAQLSDNNIALGEKMEHQEIKIEQLTSQNNYLTQLEERLAALEQRLLNNE